MAFRPLTEHHAIAEVAFALRVSPGVTHEDREQLKNAHDKWRAFLPGLNEGTAITLDVSSPRDPTPPPPVPPLQFTRFRPDGQLDWRLHILNEHIVVNCMAYTRWLNIWAQARKLFAAVGDVLPDGRQLASIGLQYINFFRWDGAPEDYDAATLLDRESHFVPSSLFGRGRYWHLHQGWFSSVTEPVVGRVLDRMHIDAIDDNGKPVVKFDNFHRLDLGSDAGLNLGRAFRAQSNRVDVCFESLHDRGKRSLSNYLTEKAEGSINLHAQ